MKNTPVDQKISQHGSHDLNQAPSAGADAVSIAPLAYGMDSVDRAQNESVQESDQEQTTDISIQLKADLSAAGGGAGANPSNRTGLPDNLKSGIENLSGYSMDDVRVHYNSSKPEQLQALAYTKGTEIHVGPGQERHLPHEAWHVVQQKQGRVKPTMQLYSGAKINDEDCLEQEASRMGENAAHLSFAAQYSRTGLSSAQSFPTDACISQTAIDNPYQLKKGSSSHQIVIQRVLRERDQRLLKEYMRVRLQQIEQLIQGIEITRRAQGEIFARLRELLTQTIISQDELDPAMEALDRGMLAIARSMMGGRSTPDDSAFRRHQWEYLMPMVAHLQSANILEHALLSSSPTPTYQFGRNEVTEWLSDPLISLQLFRRLHGSLQTLLWFANMMQDNRQGSKTFQIRDGLDLMNTVGRLSMMIADSDFLPHWDTRALPHNWTSDQFLDARRTRPGFDENLLNAVKSSLAVARSETHESVRRMVREEHEGQLTDVNLETVTNNDRTPLAEEEINLLERTRNPESNTRTNFRYQIDVRITDTHNVRMFNSGALRLEFSNARAILDRINPGARNEDLSYENIVAYLNYMSGPIMSRGMRQVFQHMGSGDPFLRELAVLLIGIEGTQNNMMMMHGPMVMDLASQGSITWNQGLFTGERRPTLESMPYFVYASDATQKGTDKGSAGPMERQTDLLRTGRFNLTDLTTERTIRERIALAQNSQQERRARDEQVAKLLKAQVELAKQSLSTRMNEELSRVGPDDRQGQIAIRQRYAEMAKQRGQEMAQKAISDLGPMPDLIEFTPSTSDKRSMGYQTFQTVYMEQQFRLMRLFINTFFPQVHSLNFGRREAGGVENFLTFMQRLMEHYMIYRFLGSGEQGERMQNLWSTSRTGIERFLFLQSGGRILQPYSSPGRLDHDGESALKIYFGQLVGQQFFINNCLIYAIARAAGREPTRQDIFQLRIKLGIGAGEALGQMLMFNPRNVGIIMNHFGLRGQVELYTGVVRENSEPTERVVHSDGSTYKIYYAQRHFTAL